MILILLGDTYIRLGTNFLGIFLCEPVEGPFLFLQSRCNTNTRIIIFALSCLYDFSFLSIMGKCVTMGCMEHKTEHLWWLALLFAILDLNKMRL